MNFKMPKLGPDGRYPSGATPEQVEEILRQGVPPRRKKPLSAKPPAVAKTVVEVAKGDPNYTPENRGRVEVEVRLPKPPAAPARRDVYEEMYWSAAGTAEPLRSPTLRG